MEQSGFYASIIARTTALLEGLRREASAAAIPFTTAQAGTMFGLFFTEQSRVDSYAQATACNSERFKLFFHAMLENGVYLAPSAYEAGFFSSAHTDEVVEETLQAARAAFQALH